MLRKLVIFALLLLAVWPGTIFAQDDELTCDEALNEAQAAYDNDKDTAWTLAAQAERLCLHDPGQFRQAQRLRGRSQGTTFDWIAAAEPGNIDLDENHSLFLACKGEGSPTVIFESGLDRDWEAWENIQPAISTSTRACAYTRSLMLPPEVRTTQDQVDDLITLLEIAEIEPPYILVGHRIAGLNLTLFTGEYPDLVAGVVLVETYHPEFWGQAVENPSWLTPGYVTWIQDHIDNPRNYLEHLDILTSGQQAAMYEDFGDIPLVVLTAGHTSFLTEQGRRVWIEFHEDFASWSTNSRHVIAENSGGNIPERYPQLVIDEILWVLDEARAAEG